MATPGLAVFGLAIVLGLVVGGPVALAADRATDCLAREQVVDRLLCLAEAARAAGDEAICHRAQHLGVRYQCLAIYAEHAASPTLCRQIPDDSEELQQLRDVCLSDVALVRSEPMLCETIQTAGLRDSCYVKQVTRGDADPGLCTRIVDAGLKSICTGEPVFVD